MALLLLLLATWFCYLPGLSGGFLFDDFVNLPALGSAGPIDNWPAFWRYVTAGVADPTGRPLALASFLIDAHDWPAEPGPFLRTNLLLHLLNGALLYRLLVVLGAALDAEPTRDRVAALLATGLWLLHPLLVSTVLYVVQREAILSTTFVIVGLLAYLHGRRLALTVPYRGVTWMAAGICGGMLLGVLCKANAALLPLLAAVLEATVLHASEKSPPGTLRRARTWLLGLPILLLTAYVATLTPFAAGEAGRPWSVAQRLLTQPRVLVDYLHGLLVPRVLSLGLFNDAYPASTSWMSPSSTLPALLLIVALVLVGWMARQRVPALSAALLFFLAGHALESTVLPLELYYEHRNYLPALLLFWPVARFVSRWRLPWALAFGTLLLSICALFTWQRCSLWSRPYEMAMLWALQQPDSARAQANAASEELARSQPSRALARTEPLWRAHPDDIQFGVNAAAAACLTRGLTRDEVHRMAITFRTTKVGGTLAFGWLAGLIDGEACVGADEAALSTWLSALRDNPAFSRVPARRQDVLSLAGRLALRQGSDEPALAAFNQALDAAPAPGVALAQAALMGQAGRPELGLRHLDYYKRKYAGRTGRARLNMSWVHERILDAQGYWASEFAALAAQLDAAVASRKKQGLQAQ